MGDMSWSELEDAVMKKTPVLTFTVGLLVRFLLLLAE